MTEDTGWAKVGARAKEKAQGDMPQELGGYSEMSPEQLEEIEKMQSKIAVQPVIQTDLLLEIRDLLVELTNEMKNAHKQVFDDYVPEYVEPRVLYDPESASLFVDIPTELIIQDEVEIVERPTVIPDPPVVKIDGEDNIINYYKEIVKTYEYAGGRYFTDDEIKQFNFAVEEERVLMKPTWLKEGFREFKRFVEDEMNGEYLTDKSGRYVLPLP